MCGIAGIWGKPDRDTVVSMTDCIATRGPDAEGFYVDQHAALGHRRLKIIDLSETSAQPLFRADRKLVVIFNGEIYNYRTIRAELEKAGHKFVSTGDTEVLLAAYEEYGEECVNHFIGMFSFAILDLRNSVPKMFIARDHFGIKPLVYAEQDGRVIFASEIKAILACGLVDPEPDRIGLQQLLINGYVVQPRTFFRDIKALEPAHAMRLIPGKEPKIWRYWDLQYPKSQALSVGMDYQDQVSRVRELLDESIRYRMISDVPLGAFLSSGIDSNAIVGLMAKQLDKPIKTFSVGFGDSGNKYDESIEAEKSAEFLKTDHTRVTLTGEDLFDLIPEIAVKMDQPTSVAVQWYIVSQAARQGVTVSLSGLGADEVFGGYENLFLNAGSAWHYGNRMKNPLLPTLAKSGLWKAIPGKEWRKKWEATAMLATIPKYYALWHMIFSAYEAKKLVVNSHNIPLDFEYFTIEDDMGIEDPINRLSRLAVKYWMVSKELRDVDAGSMAHSLEVRVPFLHRPLVEFAYGLPGSSKVGQLNPGEPDRGKRILLDAIKDVIPDWTYSKRKKGFSMPFYDWLQGPMKSLVNDHFNSAEFRNSDLFDNREVDKVWKQFQEGDARWSHIWMIFNSSLYFNGIKNLVPMGKSR